MKNISLADNNFYTFQFILEINKLYLATQFRVLLLVKHLLIQ